MGNPIHKIHTSLNMIKGFEAGYSSTNQEEMLVKIEDKVYRIKIEDTGERELTADTVKKYLK